MNIIIYKKGEGFMKKLTTEQKIEIAMEKHGIPLRELGKYYGVHHSCIDDVL